MNGANNYNICPRCGNSNSLNAKYCSRCGGQLKVPEEPVVCPKCHTHNSPMANFCRNCGGELKVGWETKICPKCGKEVDAHDNVCSCGYSFVTLQHAAPKKASGTQPQPVNLKKEKDIRDAKGGRGWAIFSLLFLLLFGYYILMPEKLLNTPLRFSALNKLDKGIMASSGYWYGGRFLYDLFANIKSLGTLGSARIILIVMTAVTALTMVVQLLACIVRIAKNKRNKYLGWYYLTMAILSALAMGLLQLFTRTFNVPVLQKLSDVFALPQGYTLGIAGWAIPVYYLFFFFLSFGSRAKKLKEKK